LNIERFNIPTSASQQPVTIDTIPELNRDNYRDIRWFKYLIVSILVIIVYYSASVFGATEGNLIVDLTFYDNGVWLFVIAPILVWFQVLFGLSTENFLAGKSYEKLAYFASYTFFVLLHGLWWIDIFPIAFPLVLWIVITGLIGVYTLVCIAVSLWWGIRNKCKT
jgi:hypothetical protein